MSSSSKKDFVLDYRSNRIRIARIDARHSPTKLDAVLELANDDDAEVADSIRRFAGAKANGYLSGSCATYPEGRFFKKVKIDCPKGKEAETLIEALRTEVNVDPNVVSAATLFADTGAEAEPSKLNKKEAILCGAPKEQLTALQDSLLERGIFPNSLEIGSIGIIGALKDISGWGDSSGPILYLEIEEDFSTLMIIGSNGVEMSRAIDSGSNEIAEAVKNELSLKDIESAEKLLASQDFDFGPMATQILRRLLRELQSSIGFYEVQTGQSISKILCQSGKGSAKWLLGSLSELLNLESLSFDLDAWLTERGVELAGEEVKNTVDVSWLGLLAMAVDLNAKGSAS